MFSLSNAFYRLFEKGARNMNIERLQSICRDYQQLLFSYGKYLLQSDFPYVHRAPRYC